METLNHGLKEIQLLMQQQHYDKALHAINELERTFGPSTDTILFRARICLYTHRYADAEKSYLIIGVPALIKCNEIYNFLFVLKKLKKIHTAINQYHQYNLADMSLNLALLYCQLLHEAGMAEHLLKHLRSASAKFQHDEQFLITSAFYHRLANHPSLSFEALEAKSGTSEHYFLELAHGHLHQQQNAKATEVLHQGLKVHPQSIALHKMLAETLRTIDPDGNIFEVLDEHIARLNQNIVQVLPLAFLKAEILITIKSFSEAGKYLASLSQRYPSQLRLSYLKSVVACRLEKYAEAEQLLDICINGSGPDKRLFIDKSFYLMRRGDFPAAESFLMKAANIAPFDQEVLGYLSVCWQQNKAQHRNWLVNQHEFVKCIPVKDDFEQLVQSEDAWHQLTGFLKQLHCNQQDPLDQSVNGGSQTTGNLFSLTDPLVLNLRQVLERAVDQYLKSLPNDPNHPFLKRKGSGFCCSGSWSVRLRGEGFHTNHVHPVGWLSGCLYVDVPSSLLDSHAMEQKAGWIKFGVSDIVPDVAPDASYPPVPGNLMLFPAYFWHGTNPFKVEEAEQGASRLTVIFDIEPVYG